MLCKTLSTIRLLLYLCCFHTVEGAAPSFTVPISETPPGSVDENSSKDISILTVEGEDTDGEKLSFLLVSQTPTLPPFLLDADSGLLKTPTGLNAEFSLTYSFTFGVSDGTTTVNSVIYTVKINDINEFTPVFQGTPYSASLLDSVRNEYQVFDANATDVDATATVTYSLISGNDPVTFALDSSNGKIIVSNSTQLASTPSYSLIIQASDTTNTVTQTVSITVDVPITSVSIDPSGNVNALTNSNLQISCTTSYGRPAADITFVMENNGNTTELQNQVITYNQSGNHFTYGHLTYQPKLSDNGSTIYCRANNTLTQSSLKTTNTLTLTVTVPITSISMDTSGKVNALANSHLQLSCTTSYGRPAADITFVIENNGNTTELQNQVITYNQSGNHFTYGHLTYQPKLSDNGSTIYCRANNTLAQSSLKSTNTLILTVTATIQAKMDDDIGPIDTSLVIIVVVVTFVYICLVAFCWYIDNGCCVCCYIIRILSLLSPYLKRLTKPVLVLCCAICLICIRNYFKDKNTSYEDEENVEGHREENVAILETIGEH